MREAIANALVGDEQRREDPTVNELERRVADLLGQEESVFVPTATMANEISLRALSEPGDELIAEENAHILLSELGGPAVQAGELMRKARRLKHQFGGARRQAGFVAAAGIYALDHNLERLADDHARARRLAEGLHAAGVPVDLEQVETNFVQVDVGVLGLDGGDALARLAEDGIGLSGAAHPGLLRAVTHLGIGDGDIGRAPQLSPQ